MTFASTLFLDRCPGDPSCIRLTKRNLPASVAMRMRIVLMLDEGASYHDIQEKMDTTAPTISLWKRRYRQDGIVGLATFHPGQPKKLTTQMRARILAKTEQPPPDGSTHWSLRNGDGDARREGLDMAGLARSGFKAASVGSLHGQR